MMISHNDVQTGQTDRRTDTPVSIKTFESSSSSGSDKEEDSKGNA